jgi:8-oxo-dGTP diphosphatase
MKTIPVVAALIRNQDQFLCTQRNYNKHEYISYKYEFPGGKVEAGETESQALIREIKEELGLDIEVSEKYFTVDHTYPDFRLVMHSFLCKAISTEIHLHEHVAYKWLDVDQFDELDWAAADIPIVEALKRDVGRWK